MHAHLSLDMEECVTCALQIECDSISTKGLPSAPQESQLSPVFPESRAHKQYASRLATFRDAHRKQAVPVDDGRFKRAEHERAHREFF